MARLGEAVMEKEAVAVMDRAGEGIPGEGFLLTEEDFLALAEEGSIVPVGYRGPRGAPLQEIYRRCRGGASFLLESDGTGPRSGRFAFIGTDPEAFFLSSERGVELLRGDGTPQGPATEGKFFDLLRSHIEGGHGAGYPGLPPFFGGAVGYVAHEAVEDFDDLFHDHPGRTLPRPPGPKALWFSPGTVLVVDQVLQTLTVICPVRVPRSSGEAERRDLHRRARGRIEEVRRRIGRGSPSPTASLGMSPLVPRRSREEFLRMVARGRELIEEGELSQIVLSQRFDAPCDEDPLELFAALRRANPSPYMFLLEFPGLAVVGASPEMLVRVRGRRVMTRPLAGTRPRGGSVAEDRALERELRSDEKERAEHMMLVDLARNDLARVSVPGSVVVTEEMGVERYARVMHLGSQVEGILRPECDALDALGAAFPAGTLSGAPKVRALERIAEIEGEPRGVYGGAVGFLGFDGDLESAIAIRTVTLSQGVLSLQVGAGVVAESDPVREYEETMHKGRALFEAFGGDEGSR